MVTLWVLSFAVRCILYDHKSSTKYNIGGNSYTTTTKTLQFPQLQNGQWDSLLNDLYKQLTQVIKEKFNKPLVPQEKYLLPMPMQEKMSLVRMMKVPLFNYREATRV